MGNGETEKRGTIKHRFFRTVSPFLRLAMPLLLAGCDLDLGPIGGSNDGGQGTISGQITDAGNSSNVTNVSINIRGAEAHNILTTSGYYSMSGLLPGSYTVTVIPPNGFEVAPNTMGTAPVQIVASEVKTVNFVLRRVATTTSVPPQARE